MRFLRDFDFRGVGTNGFAASLVLLAVFCTTMPRAIAGGYVYETPFTEPVRFDDLLAGKYPESFPISRAAFRLLHRHFPDSEWAEKTPYWYGEID